MKGILDEESQQILDIAEHNIDKEIIAGNSEISMWDLLNRKEGKARGYGPRQVMESTGSATTIQFIEMSNEKIKKERLDKKIKTKKD